MYTLRFQPKITVKLRSYRMHATKFENLQWKIPWGSEHSLSSKYFKNHEAS